MICDDIKRLLPEAYLPGVRRGCSFRFHADQHAWVYAHILVGKAVISYNDFNTRLNTYRLAHAR